MTTPGAPGRIGDIGRALAGAVSGRELWAILIAVVVTPLITITLAILIGLLTPFGAIWSGWPASWFSLSDVAFALLLVTVWQAASIALIPAAMRPVMEVQTWIGERDLAAWHHATGTPRWRLPPTSPGAAERWLASNPETDANRGPRIEVLLLARRFDEAREALGRLAPVTEVDRLAAADLAATASFLERGELDLEPMREAIAAAGDPEARRAGAAWLALLEVRGALAAGTDWTVPLREVRPVIGAVADGILWRRFLPRRLLVIAPVALAVTVAFGVLRLGVR